MPTGTRQRWWLKCDPSQYETIKNGCGITNNHGFVTLEGNLSESGRFYRYGQGLYKRELIVTRILSVQPLPSD